jgi:hypothetical protein
LQYVTELKRPIRMCDIVIFVTICEEDDVHIPLRAAVEWLYG